MKNQLSQLYTNFVAKVGKIKETAKINAVRCL